MRLASSTLFKKIKHRFSLLLLLLLCTGASTAGKIPAGETYPDVWYRLYEWPVHVCDMFLSDKKIWGNEPVLILCNGDKSDGVAEGFFSKKRRAVKRTRVGNKWLYLYWPSKRAMSARYTYEPNDAPVKAHFKDGSWLEITSESRTEMHWYGIKKSGTDTNDEISSFPLIWSEGCEPLRRSLKRLDGKGNLLWEKTTTRYYRKGEIPPPNYFLDAGHPGCRGYEAWLSEGAEPFLALRLSDDTLLTTSAQSTYVIRIRRDDGMSKSLPPNLAVLDMEAVVAAKREMVERYLHSIRIAKQSAKDGPEFLDRYFDFTNPEKVYRELASYFFENECPTPSRIHRN